LFNNNNNNNKWHSKALHGQWLSLLLERSAQSSAWLRKVHLNPVTEGLIVAAPLTGYIIFGEPYLMITAGGVESLQRALSISLLDAQ